MLHHTIAEFLAATPQGRLAGLDMGRKTIGIAISDTTRTVASPCETYLRKKFTQDAKYLEAFFKHHDIGGVIIGLPLGMDGKENPACQSIRQFAQNLLKIIPIEILLCDERFSTSVVERALLDADMSRERRGEVIDKMAAAYILQGVLDQHKNF